MTVPVNVRFVNMPDFNSGLVRFMEKQVPWKFDIVLKKIAFELMTSIIELTPVDTGRARGGWQLDVGTFSTDEIERFDKIGEATLQKGMAKLASITGGLMGKVIYIYNNVRYIVYLEFGTDKMAPFGMVRMSLGLVQAQTL